MCSVVVGGSGLALPGAAPGLPVGQARGGSDRERRESAQREPLRPRACGHKAQLGGAPACARAPQRQLPRLPVGEVALFALVAAGVEQRGQRGGVVRVLTGTSAARARTPCAGALQRSVPGVDDSKITRGSRHAKASFLHLLGAYGVSCRARVRSTLRHILWRFAPAAFRLHWVPRSSTPWGRGFGTNGRQANRFPCKLHYTREECKVFADGQRARRTGLALITSPCHAQERASTSA